MNRTRPVRWWLAATDGLWLARWLLDRAIRKHREAAGGVMLDVGCGGKRYRRLFGHVDRYVGVDLPAERSSADVFADAMRLPFADAVFDTLLCNQVLEHVHSPDALMREAARVLKVGGSLILSTPQVWGLHHEPHDYFRFTKYGLRHLAARHGLDVVEVTATCGLWATIAQRVADTSVHEYAASWPTGVRRLIGLVVCPILAAGLVMDRLLGRRGDTLDNVLIARKGRETGSADGRASSMTWHTHTTTSPTDASLSQAA